MKTSTILWIVAGLGVAYAVKKASDATKAKIEKITSDRDKAAGLTRIGDGSSRPGSLLDAAGNLVRPIGADLSSRIGARQSTDGLGESFSSAPENDGGMFGGGGNTAIRSGLALMTINPYAKDRAARVQPWWANRAKTQINYSTPTDPYALQAVDAKGDPTNAQLQSQFSDGRPDRVDVASHGIVTDVAQEQPYVEPGDRSYGDMTATDFMGGETDTYDEDPGAMIGLREG